MAEVQTGFFWHVHHEVLIEWCYSYNERASYISEQKREDQKETRLRLFKPVKGKLPQEVVEAGQAYVKAGQALNEAQQARVGARQVYDKAWQASDKAWQVYVEARQAYVEARQAYNKAWRALNEALRKNMPDIEALHKEECHNCPWNGKTIFPGS